jgi:hypothetical protein
MSSIGLFLASLLFFGPAVAEAQILQPVSDEREVVFHLALVPSCGAADTLYRGTPVAPFAPYEESTWGTLRSEACQGGVDAHPYQRSAIFADSIFIFASAEAYFTPGGECLTSIAESNARIRFRVEEGTRYYFDTEAFGDQWAGGGVLSLTASLSGPGPDWPVLESVSVHLAGTVFSGGDSRQHRGILGTGEYTLEARARSAIVLTRSGGFVKCRFSLSAPTAVEHSTWERVKSLYRSHDAPSNHMLQPSAPHDGK